MTLAEFQAITAALNAELDRLQEDARAPVLFSIGAIAGVKRALTVIKEHIEEDA